ncbi:hypothetical protein ATANTOWER_029880 [Ataeniobius toweri]|uniref:Sulfotransferase n=1 Tax=Ataeniobius toweri TaxID=208326 RepID=A0ABU7CN23_9TELE|nr:hypothetical protein [Ataeniobius toweri]
MLGNLEKPINITVMFKAVGGSRSTRCEPTHARGEHANSMQKYPRPGTEPRTFLLGKIIDEIKELQKFSTDLELFLCFISGVAGDWKNHLTPEEAEHFDAVFKEKMKDVKYKFAWD